MKYIMCVVRDRVADVYGTPFCTVSTGMAVRSFGDQVNRDEPNNAMFAHADDFELFEVGSFDDSSADFEILPKPRQLVLGKDVKRKA